MRINDEQSSTSLKRTAQVQQGGDEHDAMLDSETRAYAEHIRSMIPPAIDFDPSGDVYSQLADGVVLAYALDAIHDGCVNMNLIKDPVDMGRKTGIFEATSNLAEVLNGASVLGISAVNIGAEDILHGNKRVVINMLWQIVRMSMVGGAGVRSKLELVKMLDQEESPHLPAPSRPEDILLRWIGMQLKNAEGEKYMREIKRIYRSYLDNTFSGPAFSSLAEAFCDERSIGALVRETQEKRNYRDGVPIACSNYSSDIGDSRIYLVLMRQMPGEEVSDLAFYKAYFEVDSSRRAAMTLEIADRLQCRKFVGVDEVLSGDPKLNFLFVAALFSSHMTLPGAGVAESKALEEEIERLEGTLLEKASEITMLRQENERLLQELGSREDLERATEESIRSTREMYEATLSEYKANLDAFASEVCRITQRKDVEKEAGDSGDSKSRIMYVINSMQDEIELLRLERDELELRRSPMDAAETSEALDEAADKRLRDEGGCMWFICRR
jgi:hypothetical protein